MLWGADLYLHFKHGINPWGYRGPSAGKKQSGEQRVAVLGGSTTWGFGLKSGQDFPAQLQGLLLDDKRPQIRVLNFGSNGEGAYSFTQTLHDYDYLDPDLIILYSGYNDLNAPNYYNFRHRSPLFGLTGYLPLLPSLTVDKLSVWKKRLMGGDQRIVFTPPQLDREDEASTLRKQLKELELRTTPGEGPPPTSCSPKWKFYCDQIVGAVELSLTKGRRVIVAGEPYLTDDHVEQQFELEKMLAVKFAGDSRVRYVNLGRVVDLRDQTLCWDGMHLTEEGNRRIAAALRQPTVEMLR